LRHWKESAIGKKMEVHPGPHQPTKQTNKQTNKQTTETTNSPGAWSPNSISDQTNIASATSSSNDTGHLVASSDSKKKLS